MHTDADIAVVGGTVVIIADMFRGGTLITIHRTTIRRTIIHIISGKKTLKNDTISYSIMNHFRPPLFDSLYELQQAAVYLQTCGYVVFDIPQIDVLSDFKLDLSELNPELNMSQSLFDYRRNIDYPAGNESGLVGEYGLSHGKYGVIR